LPLHRSHGACYQMPSIVRAENDRDERGALSLRESGRHGRSARVMGCTKASVIRSCTVSPDSFRLDPGRTNKERVCPSIERAVSSAHEWLTTLLDGPMLRVRRKVRIGCAERIPALFHPVNPHCAEVSTIYRTALS
jgi:hypothetical protein